MGSSSQGKSNKHKWLTLTSAISIFAIVYMAGAISDAANRYQRAELIARSQADTNVGREGYEYIFELNTHIFIDKILPNSEKIITFIVIEDYLPISMGFDGGFLEKDIYEWMRFRIFYPHDQKPMVLRLILYASIAAMLTGVVVYLISKR